MYPIYNMYDSVVLRQQAEMYHDHQIQQIVDCLRKLNDFLDSAEKVAPEYQSQLLASACALVIQRQSR